MTPVPVAGMILDPLAQVPALSTRPAPRGAAAVAGRRHVAVGAGRRAELAPGGPGVRAPGARPCAVRAAAACTRTYGGTDSYVNLGEWQVIAEPGMAAAAHVQPRRPGAWVGTSPGCRPDPPTRRQPGRDALGGRRARPGRRGSSAQTPISWAIGFQDDRAAQLTDLEWVDAPGSRSRACASTQVQVAVSTEQRAGAVAGARHLGAGPRGRRLRGAVPPSRADLGALRALHGAGPEEHGLPGDARPRSACSSGRSMPTYRSVLGAWGRGERPRSSSSWCRPIRPRWSSRSTSRTATTRPRRPRR